ANPVIQALKLQKSDHPPRLWWCPTGPFAFLPIHAAGIYNSGELNECVADYMISSYTPTLSSLLASQSQSSAPSNPFKVTAVIQPDTPGYSCLPFTEKELVKIEEKVPKQWLTSFGTAERQASIDRVLPHLQTSSIVHFACHGIQDAAKPLQSALLIGDERLTVAQIMEKSASSHNTPENTTEKQMGLAFLSACQTAMGDEKVPDEAMHLAASLLFAGFHSVVATMWTMYDPDGPEIAEAFYGHLFRNSAEALHLAVAKLRKTVPFARWVPFVHYGF
ncbi:CHAT domain-containing protein, partial [Mycena sp. CBHHK59/15]